MEDPAELEKQHIEMWRHYETIRLQKNNAFLVSNSVLVAVAGILSKGPLDYSNRLYILAVSVLGIAVCAAGLLLLKRNAAYIEYHRKIAGRGDARYWTPKSRTPRAKHLEPVPLFVFLLFWVGFAMAMSRPLLKF